MLWARLAVCATSFLLLAGCPLFPLSGGSVRDVANDNATGQPQPNGTARVSVRVTNRTSRDVLVMVQMDVGPQMVNTARVLTPTDRSALFGPDDAVFVNVFAAANDDPSLVYLDRDFQAFNDFQPGERIVLIITEPEPNEPNEPKPQPPTITCPESVTLACGDSIDPADTGEPTAAGGCSALTITHVDTGDASACPAVITRTWTATDECGATAECAQTITLTDETPPQITCPPDASIACGDDPAPAVTGEATATDNAAGDVAITFDDALTEGCPGQVVRTWIATDAAGNRAECDQTISVVDETVPQITCPPDAEIGCHEEPTPELTGEATATDNAAGEVTITFEDTNTEGCPGQITRTWIATDAAGNSAECTQTITLVDETPPDLTCPEDTVIDCLEEPLPTRTGLPTATDNSGGEVMITYEDDLTPGCPGQISRTWIAVDAAGNRSECTQLIGLADKTAPLITCPPDVEVRCGDPIDPVVEPSIDCAQADGPVTQLQPGEFDGRFVQVGFVAEGQIGDSLDWKDEKYKPELTVGASAHGPFGEGQTSDFCWRSKPKACFALHYDPEWNTVTFSVSDKSVSYEVPEGTPLSDLYLRVYSPKPDGSTRVTLSDLVLNDHGLDQGVEASYEAGGLNVLRIACGDLQDGFWLSGEVELSFDPNDKSLSCSGFGFQIIAGQLNEPPGTGVATAIDAIDPEVDISYEDFEVDQECGLIERTWRATDDAGNVSECVQRIYRLIDT